MQFPKNVKDNDYKNLLTQMLNKNQSKRLSKFDDISNHNWFKGFNWEDLNSLKMKPPFIPKVENNEEKCKTMAYIDFVKTLEEWVPESGQTKPSKKVISEFESWFRKF